ncbi:helix-turn-helix domain-containing protein [Pseudomonas sp. NPDC090202]|uniref:helix-turn-helix domain-containing protein n=1 Tax=unclassified Pseudomonas TaxID=196821 RepID=UPI0037F86AAC
MVVSGDKVVEGELVGGPQVDFAPESLALFSDDECGAGLGPTEREKEELGALMVIVSERLTRARHAAGMKQLDVARRLGHANLTMISLFENGKRVPSLKNLLVLADMYQVTIDFLLGRTDDLGLAPEDGNQALITGVLTTVLTGINQQYLQKLSEVTAISIESASLDRVLLGRVADSAIELADALTVIQKHHGDVFDSLRGGGKLVRAIGELELSVKSRILCKQHEKALADYEHPVLTVQQVTTAVQHALFS